jgi:hypothetical protein
MISPATTQSLRFRASSQTITQQQELVKFAGKHSRLPDETEQTDSFAQQVLKWGGILSAMVLGCLLVWKKWLSPLFFPPKPPAPPPTYSVQSAEEPVPPPPEASGPNDTVAPNAAEAPLDVYNQAVDCEAFRKAQLRIKKVETIQIPDDNGEPKPIQVFSGEAEGSGSERHLCIALFDQSDKLLFKLNLTIQNNNLYNRRFLKLGKLPNIPEPLLKVIINKLTNLAHNRFDIFCDATPEEYIKYLMPLQWDADRAFLLIKGSKERIPVRYYENRDRRPETPVYLQDGDKKLYWNGKNWEDVLNAED